jgi:hypothetical protein
MRSNCAGLVLGVAVAALGACGSGSPPNSNAPATASAACLQLHMAYANRSARCAGGTAADWLAYIDAYEDCAAYTNHVADRQVVYRPQGWAACVAEYEGPCDQLVSYCEYDILHGLTPDGAPCKDSEVCGTASACLDMALSSGTCGSMCMREATVGEKCGFWCGGTAPCVGTFPFCAPGASCGPDGTCVTAKAAGAACGPSDPVACAPLLACSADPADQTSTGTCQVLGASGCHADGDCPGGQFCLQGTCTPRRALGENCTDAPTGCVAWAACDAGGRCAAAGRIGMACAQYPGVPDFVTCLTGSCFDGMKCTAFAKAGESCAAATCSPGTSCDAATNTCVACAP